MDYVKLSPRNRGRTSETGALRSQVEALAGFFIPPEYRQAVAEELTKIIADKPIGDPSKLITKDLIKKILAG